MAAKTFRDTFSRWNQIHAAWLLLFVILYAYGLVPALSLSAAAGISFAVLVWLGCAGRHWGLPLRGLGMANAVTLGRLGLVLALPLSGRWAAGLALLVWLLDGLDGFLARRLGEVSAFGDLLDKETDACFTLILCLLLAERGLPLWILLAGGLRYGFVLALRAFALRADDLPSLRVARWLGSVLLISLIFGLIRVPPGYLWILAGVMPLSLFSFAHSFYYLWRNRPASK